MRRSSSVACLLERLLDPGRVDAAVLEQLLEGDPRDLAADAVEARQQHGAGRVVDDEVDPGEGLEGADVAALAADDPALQLVGLELDHRHGGLHRVTAGHALHAGGEDAARAPVGVVAGLLLDLADQPGAVVAQLVLQLAQQDLLGLAGAQPRHPLELAHVLALGLLQARRAVLEVARASSAVRSRASSASWRRGCPPSPAGAPRAARAPRAGRAAPVAVRAAGLEPAARAVPGRAVGAGRVALRAIPRRVIGVRAIDPVRPSRSRGRQARRDHDGPARAQGQHHDRGRHPRRYERRQQDLHVQSPPPARCRDPFSPSRP